MAVVTELWSLASSVPVALDPRLCLSVAEDSGAIEHHDRGPWSPAVVVAEISGGAGLPRSRNVAALVPTRLLTTASNRAGQLRNHRPP